MYDALRLEITNTSSDPSATGWRDYTYINGSSQTAPNDAAGIATQNTFFVTGDYDGNGIVDAADYTLWRDSLGSTTNLAADGNENEIVDAGDYDVWTMHFGQTAGGGASSAQSERVPEPSCSVLLVTGILAMWTRRRTGLSSRTRP
jgi:hypothetical protein